jgi:hypothetical protein
VLATGPTGEFALLRDGGQVLLRPYAPGDRDAVAALFARLSPESRLMRFHSAGLRIEGDTLARVTAGHALVAEFGEQAGRDVTPSEVGTSPALGGDRPRDDEHVAVVELGPGLHGAERDGPLRVDGETPFDLCRALALPDGAGVRATTQQEPQTGDDHRLARTGLARDDRQPRAELQDGVRDDPQPPQAHLEEHLALLPQSAGRLLPLVAGRRPE